MNRGFQIFKNEAELIRIKYPELILDTDEKDSIPSISGIIPLNDENGHSIDSYKIKIVPTPDYPYRFPHVFETSGRIPINNDWHIYTDDGHCCISTFPEEILNCKNGLSLSNFIENHVIPFFFNQKHRELYGFFLKERSHGIEGNIQFFIETFRIKDLATIIKCLIFIRQRKEPNRISRCFCGSGLKYRKCHRETYREFCAFNNDELNYFIEMVTSVATN